MSSRHHLTSVADGVARAFASRNNDVDGWWALGLLISAVPPGDPDYQIDLLTGEALPAPAQPDLRLLGSAWARYLRWSLQRHDVPIAAVRSAALVVRFDRQRRVGSWIPGGRDRPFRVTATIEDDRGHRHERVAEGHCASPDEFVDANPDLRPRRAGVGTVPRVLERTDGPGRPSDIAGH